MSNKSGIEAIFTATLEFDTKGKKISESEFKKIARVISSQQGRKFVCSRLRKNHPKAEGILVSTRKGAMLSQEQKSIARNKCMR